MPYIQPKDRNQMMICTLTSFIEEDSIARVIDVFVDSLDMEALGFQFAKEPYEGNPAYDPRCLLKLYLYGGQKGIRSSRKLAEAARLNVEARWLVSGLEPDFRTVSDFRKNNVCCLKKVFREFNRKLADFLQKGYLSIDGSKFQACNAKDNNFTANKLDDRITWLNQHTDEYLRQIEAMDEAESERQAGGFTKEELEEKLKETRERLELYEGYRKYMEENGLGQLSLTDADAKLMKTKNGFGVSYNVQTAVDSETHMIEDYQVTNQPTDHGQLEPTLHEVKVEHPDEIIEALADTGYQQPEDMAACLESGIIPHVIPQEGQDTYELELPYEESEISEEMRKSCKAEDLKQCLRAGEIPEVYEEVITKAEIADVRVLVRENETEENSGGVYKSEEEMKERAREGYFVRDPERNIVYCPAGSTLRQKSIKNNGNIRYANKMACKKCKDRDRCYKGKNDFKEVDFNKDTLEKVNRNWQKAMAMEQTETQEDVAAPETVRDTENQSIAEISREQGADETTKSEIAPGTDPVEAEAETKKDSDTAEKRKGHYEKKKIVRITLKPDRKKMDLRKCTSEHPFGTIKRAMNAGYYLLQGKQKVDGETALACLGYNIKRATNLFGIGRLIEIMA